MPDVAMRPDGVTVLPKTSKDEAIFDSGLRAFLDEENTLECFERANIVRVLDLFEANATA